MTLPQPQGQGGRGAALTEETPSKWHLAFVRITQGNWLISVLAVVLALIVGGIMIAATDPHVQASSGYFFARPGDTIVAIANSVGGAYAALFRGSIYNFSAPDFARGIRPFTETLTFATPLISASRSRSASACSTSAVAARC